MSPEELNFQTFFAEKMKDRGLSVRKLSDATGIAPAHLEAMLHGRFDDLPSAPYVRGYLVRLGKALDFDGETWWRKLSRQEVPRTGDADELPRNRFIRESRAKFAWAGVTAALLFIYLLFQLPIIFGKPSLAVTFPPQNPYSAISSMFTFQGKTKGASSLSINGDSVSIAADGSWQKTVLLQNGPNAFTISAKKLLGRETSVTEQIFYQSLPVTSSSSTATSTISSTTQAR